MNIKQLITSNSRFSEIIRFGIVGGTATIIQYGLYYVFVNFVGVSPVLSAPISYALSFLANFFLSSFFTFHKKPTAKIGLGFTLSHLINMGLQTLLVAIFSAIDWGVSAEMQKTLALLPAMLICIPINYLLVHYVFNSKLFQSKEERLKSEIDTF